MMNDQRLLRQIEQHPYPLLFATISGAHLYRFPSPDSDYDLRGVHLLPLEDDRRSGKHLGDVGAFSTSRGWRRSSSTECGRL